jgi:hypothetical protein
MMLTKTGPNKTYTVAELIAEATKMVKGEMSGLKNNKPLNAEEALKAETLAKFISKTVLKEMKIA